MAHEDRLVWIDLEMSGLNVDRERIIEAAMIITDSNLETVAQLEPIVIHQSDELLAAMDHWNTEHHGKSGLTAQVKASTITETEAEERLLSFVQEHTSKGTSPLCGNSVYIDRMFLRRYMPEFEGWFHYRNVDVSTLKELVARWYPQQYEGRPRKRGLHRALDDIRESIEELAYYRSRVMREQAPRPS